MPLKYIKKNYILNNYLQNIKNVRIVASVNVNVMKKQQQINIQIK